MGGYMWQARYWILFHCNSEKRKQTSAPGTVKLKGSVVNDSENADISEESAEDAAPGFGIISGVVCLFCVFLYRIKA